MFQGAVSQVLESGSVSCFHFFLPPLVLAILQEQTEACSSASKRADFIDLCVFRYFSEFFSRVQKCALAGLKWAPLAPCASEICFERTPEEVCLPPLSNYLWLSIVRFGGAWRSCLTSTRITPFTPSPSRCHIGPQAG